MEGRVDPEEKHFGYEWGNALQGMSTSPIRTAAARYLIGSMPEIEALSGTQMSSRGLPWSGCMIRQPAASANLPLLGNGRPAVGEVAGAVSGGTPHSLSLAERLSKGLQERTRPKAGGEPSLSDVARKMATMSNMIAARKFFLLATDVASSSRSERVR